MTCQEKQWEIKILDGGFGTQISKHVGQRIDGDALWSARFLATNKEAVLETHLEFLKAGSDIITTNTYQASIEGFQEHLNLTKDESYNLIKEGVRLAKKARDIFISTISDTGQHYPLVAGSVGPYAASLHDGSEYTTSYENIISAKALTQWHRPRITALIEAGVDLLAFETLPCNLEAEVLLNLIKEFPDVKVWISFNCKDEKSIASGENFQETLKKCFDLNSKQVIAFGANCTSPGYIEELFSGINVGRESNPLPLIVYPNSGENYTTNVGWCNKDKCEPIDGYVFKWLDLGIRWIGGCCRTYADDIKKIKVEVNKWKGRRRNECA